MAGGKSYRYQISVLSIVPPPQRQEFTTKFNLSQHNLMVVFRFGIIDKTAMYEAARQKCSRDCSVWVLYVGTRFGNAPEDAF